MKKRGIITALILSFIGGIIFIPPLVTRNNTSFTANVIDLINPFVGQSTVYVKTSTNYESTYEDAANHKDNFQYIGTTFDQKGKKRKLSYVSFGKEITPDTYLKITTKGQSLRDWEYVSPEDIPQKALDKLTE